MKRMLRLGLIGGAIILLLPPLLNYLFFGDTARLFLPSNERMGDGRQAKIRQRCFPAVESPHLDKLGPRPAHDQHRMGWRDLHRMAEMTAALNCYLVTHPDAVCDRDNRAYIVDYINRYFAKFDEMLSAAQSYGEAEIATVQNLWDSSRNRAINAALTNNISIGRLVRADFGWLGPPAALKPILDQHQTAAESCPASG